MKGILVMSIIEGGRWEAEGIGARGIAGLALLRK